MTETTKKAPLPARIGSGANNNDTIAQRIKPIDASFDHYQIPTAALLQVLDMLNQVAYVQASPIITTLMMTVEPVEGGQE